MMFAKGLADELLSKTAKIEAIDIDDRLTSSSSSSSSSYPSNKTQSHNVPKTQCPRCKHFIRDDLYRSHLNSHTAKITDYLYLGSEANARNRKELTVRTNICYVLNVAAECDNYSPDLFVDGDTYLKVPLYDNIDASDEMRTSLEAAFDFIDRARSCDGCSATTGATASIVATEEMAAAKAASVEDVSSRGNDKDIKQEALEEDSSSLTTKTGATPCLVHCIQGISRSSTIVIGYLMSREGLTLRHAFDHVRSLRPIVQPNLGFAEVLLELERQIIGSNSTTIEEMFQKTM